MLGSKYCYCFGVANVEQIMLNSTDVQSFQLVRAINSSLSFRTSIFTYISFNIAIVA